MLPGPKWSSPLAARTWLISERRRLGWSPKDVERAFGDCAYPSDLYSGPGGGPLFDRATVKRVERFERECEHIPDWLYWIPLAIELAAVPRSERFEWEREHIPAHGDLRREGEEYEEFARTYVLDDEELDLIERFRAMDGNQRLALLTLTEPRVIEWFMDCLRRSADDGFDLVETINAALAEAGEKGKSL